MDYTCGFVGESSTGTSAMSKFIIAFMSIEIDIKWIDVWGHYKLFSLLNAHEITDWHTCGQWHGKPTVNWDYN